VVFATRLVSHAHHHVIVDAAHGRGIRPDREPTLLFELHRALAPNGLLWWSTPPERVGELVQRAQRLGLVVARVGVWIGAATTASIIALQRSSADIARASAWPLVVAVPPDASRAEGWRTILAASGLVRPDGWLTEIGAPDATVGVMAVGLGMNWLAHGTARRKSGSLSSGEGEAVLTAAGARMARFLPELLSPPRPTTHPADLFATAAAPAERTHEADPPVAAPTGLRLVADRADNDAPPTDHDGHGASAAVPLGKATLARVAMRDLDSPHQRTATGGVAR
jgi:hypothetical protein